MLEPGIARLFTSASVTELQTMQPLHDGIAMSMLASMRPIKGHSSAHLLSIAVKATSAEEAACLVAQQHHVRTQNDVILIAPSQTVLNMDGTNTIQKA